MDDDFYYFLLFVIPGLIILLHLHRKMRNALNGKDRRNPNNSEYWINIGYSWDPIKNQWSSKRKMLKTPKYIKE